MPTLHALIACEILCARIVLDVEHDAHVARIDAVAGAFRAQHATALARPLIGLSAYDWAALVDAQAEARAKLGNDETTKVG